MEDAIRDGDPIQAVIRSSACNHGGRSEGITMPNGLAHRKLLKTVHEMAGLDPSQTPVVEVRIAISHPIQLVFFGRRTNLLTRVTELALLLGMCFLSRYKIANN